MTDNDAFDYGQAFVRNLGLVSEAEQQRLAQTRVALPGLGGVGGAHVQVLARLGIGRFHLADPDTFETANFNRQLGANVSTLGRRKAEVLAETARSINPQAEIQTFPDGISPENLDRFLAGVDVVVDGLEYFAIEVRRMLYHACRARGIPVVHAGPIGYGVTLLVFTPEGISFDEFFGVEDSMTKAEMLIAHAAGHGRSLKQDIDGSRVDLARRTGPSLGSACLLCAALAATEVLKLRCGRGELAVAPKGVHFDPYRMSLNQLSRSSALPRFLRTIRWRLIRGAVFRRMPQFREMHDSELKERSSKVAVEISHAAV